MVNQILVNILVKRIDDGWINPKTKKAIELDDILDPEYKEAVVKILGK